MKEVDNEKSFFKPSKPVSFIGFVGGVSLSLFGIIYAVPNLGIFGIVWSAVAVLVTLYYAINLFTKKGLSLFKVEVREDAKKKSK